jgi:hypothetical protein
MKFLTRILVCILLPLSIFAQVEQKPPMLHYETSLLTNYYTLGNKRLTDKEVGLHLEKTSPKAYYTYRRSLANNKAAWGFLIPALGFTIWEFAGIFKKPPVFRPGVSLLSLVTLGIGLGFSLSAISKQRKARDIYNAQYGY